MRAASSLSLARVIVGCVAVAWSCACSPGHELPSNSECTPGEAAHCSEAHCVGQRTCDANGHWRTCECNPSTLGQACDSDKDCESPEVCFNADHAFLGGWPSAGTCSLPCKDDPSLCELLQPDAACVDTSTRGDGTAHCLLKCEPGGPARDKCLERQELGCAIVNTSTDDRDAYQVSGDGGTPASFGVCRPLCTQNAECGEGRCDLRTGACTSNRREGQPLGSPCSPSDPQSCEGVCVDVEGVFVCSHRCRLAGPYARLQRRSCGGFTRGHSAHDTLPCTPIAVPRRR